MNTLKTIALFILLALLAAYVYFYEIKGGEEREQADKIAQKIVNFEPDSIQLVEIRSVFNRFMFERIDENWKIRNPVQTEADNSVVNSLLNTLKNMTKVREFTISEGEYKDYGLVGRSYLVILENTSGIRDSVRFGDETPVGNNVFVSTEGNTVYTVASYLKNNVTKNLFDWRDKSLVKINQSDVKELRLKNEFGHFYLKKEGKNWHFSEPRSVRADNSAVDALIRKFQNGNAKAIVSESKNELEKYDLKRPAFQLDFYLGEALAHKQVNLSKVKKNTAHLIDDSRPQIMTVDSSFVKDINKSFFDLRHKKIAEYDKGVIDSVTVVQGDSSFYFVIDTSGTWFYDGTLKVKNWKMNGFLNSINSLQATEFIQENISVPTGYGLMEPDKEVRLFSNGSQVLHLLLKSWQAKKIAYTSRSKIIAEIASSSFNSLAVKKDEFVESPPEIPEDDA